MYPKNVIFHEKKPCLNMTSSFLKKSPNMAICNIDSSNNTAFAFSINLCVCNDYVVHSSCTICLYTTVSSVVGSVFVLMHAAELLQLFHQALPKPASCTASPTARGHSTEGFVFVYFVFNSLVVAGALMHGEFCLATLCSRLNTSDF